MTTTKISTVIDRLARKCKVEAELVEDAYPCTGLQAALIAASLNELGDYVSRFVFDLSNTDRNPQVFRAGCEELYEQTAILRSRVIENNGQFLQVVVQNPLEWHEHDNLQEYLARDRKAAVDLGKPLTRIAWVYQPDGKTYMVWSLHHCQYDDWSFKLMVKDLNAASAQSQEPGSSITTRTPYSKFIKALKHVDQAASDSFWQTKLREISKSGTISSTTSLGDASRTSSRCEKAYTVQLQPNSQYQGSELAVAAWSLLVSHFSGSSHILFGHVLSGRTSDLQGIQEICGPTLATVPWYIHIDEDLTVKEYLEALKRLRLEVLPYEQTGLAQYRKMNGTAAFDTLLSVRAAQDESDLGNEEDYIKPEKPDATDLNHPCSIFLEVDMEGEDCKLKASYDDRSIDANLLAEALDKFVLAFETLSSNLETKVGDFRKSLQLSPSIDATSKPASAPLQATCGQLPADAVDKELMQKVEKLALSTAGVQDASEVNADTTLMQLGMDSLKTVVFSRNLSKAFKVEIPFKDITGPRRTLSDIASSIEQASRGHDSTLPQSRTSLQNLAENHMDSIRSGASPLTFPSKETHPQNRPALLLTGATGYLGIEILRQCLSTSDAEVVLLVRCVTPEDGIERITRTAKMALWSSSEIHGLKRVQIWPSDIAQDRLGLSAEHWHILDNPQSSSLHFRAFIHNGAKVDFLHTYADLEAANVRSTAILLAQHVKAAHKPNFVFVTGGRPCPLTPDDPESTAMKLAAAPGYAQTKFVSELLVHKTKALYQSRGQDVRMAIVHPGSIIGSANTGVANTDDFVWRYVAASLTMGYYVLAVPTKREWINITPVDAVAEEIVSLALAHDSLGQSMKGVERCLMRYGLSIRQFWDIIASMLQPAGKDLQPVSEWEWLAEFEGDLEVKGQEQPLFSLSQLLLQGNLTGIGGQPPSIDSKTGVPPDTTFAEAALRSNVQYLSEKGFLSLGAQQVGHGTSIFARSKA